MKVAHFGILLLALVGALPLSVSGVTTIRRAEQTALEEVKRGNSRVAARAASRLSSYVDEEIKLLRTIGTSFTPAVHSSASQRERIIKNYRISFPELRELDF